MRIESGRMLNDYIQPNKKQYCIPVFQRDYAWTSEQCEKLFEDIVLAFEKDRLHFCGSFVYAPLPTRKHIDRYIIIDGQQRFTTLYILIKALADSATDEADKAALEKYLYNEDKFNRYGLDDKSKLKLKPVKTDNDQLQLLMAGKLDKMNKGKDGIIYHNYMLFRELIATFLAEDPDNSIMMIHDGMDSLICADIKLDQDDDAQEIFERINSTGIKLGLPDLIRNYVLMTDDDQERLYEEYWLVMQELLSKDRMESFFLDYLNMKMDGFTKESEAYRDFKQIYLNGQYTNESMLSELLHYAKQYHIFLNSDESLGSEINSALDGLRRLNQTTVYLFLFHIFDDYENGVIDKTELAKVLNLLLHYSIRRLICEIGSKNALCKYILATIENQGKEKLVMDNLTIEHIMPQNKNLSTAWQKMLGDDWTSVRERYLHTLGNLTLTAHNSELGDSPFHEKQEMLLEKNTHVTVLNKDVMDKTDWNARTIEKRTERLTGVILKLFPIEQPKQEIEFRDPRYTLYTVEDPRNATYKHVDYYELLGERVNVDSFAFMVRSVARKLFDLDSSIIEAMAKNHEKFPTWLNPVFSYEETGVKNPVELKKDAGIYISTGYSAYDCICFIRALLQKYDLDIVEDFVYSARPTKYTKDDQEEVS